MANYVLPMVARKRRVYPYWADAEIAAGQIFTKASDSELLSVKQGLVLLGGDLGETYIPIASNLTANKIEVLVKLEKIHAGNETYANTGGTIVFRPTNPNYYKNGYQFCLGSGTASNIYMYNYTRSGGFNRLTTAAISNLNALNKPLFMRTRVNNGELSFKVWFADVSEPTAWSATAADAEHEVTNIGFLLSNYNQVLKIHGIAYATNGDTATFDLPPVVDVMAGTVPNVKGGDIVNIHDLATHDIINSIELPTSGAWVAELYNNKPVYGRVERASGSEYDFLFAKYGNTYLGGDYPDGALKDDGVPSEGEVSVLYRSDDPILGGATIAKVSAAQSGEWRISGLQPNVPFDVVARKPSRKDVVVSGVIGVPDPDFKFVVMGNALHDNGYIKGLLLAKGAANPLSAKFLGSKPYGLDDSAAVPDGNSILINSPMREYGNFNFSIDITDNNNKTVNTLIELNGAVRAPFVDLITYIDPIQGGTSSTNDIVITIPDTVAIGDVMLIAVTRRYSQRPTVTDSNQGVWTRAVSSPATGMNYDQWNDIYWRYAKQDDIGKSIAVQKLSGLLIVSMAVFRGKYAALAVKETYAFSDRYNSTSGTAIKDLSPITHSSGFLVRLVSNVYAVSSDTGAFTRFNNLTNLGPTVGGFKRTQVGVKHLGEAGVFSGTTYETGSTTAADTQPDVAIILDEIRP